MSKKNKKAFIASIHHLIITVMQCPWMSVMELVTQLCGFPTLLWEVWLISQIKTIEKKKKKKGQSMNHRGEELNYGGARRMSRHKIKRLIRETLRFITRWLGFMEYKEAADFLALILFPLAAHYEPKNVARFHPHSLWTRGKKPSGSIEDTSGRCTARWQRVRQDSRTTTEGTEETLAGFLLWSATLNPPESSRGSGGRRCCEREESAGEVASPSASVSTPTTRLLKGGRGQHGRPYPWTPFSIPNSISSSCTW